MTIIEIHKVTRVTESSSTIYWVTVPMAVVIVIMCACLWCRKPPPKPRIRHTIIDEPDYRQEEEDGLIIDEEL